MEKMEGITLLDVLYDSKERVFYVVDDVSILTELVNILSTMEAKEFYIRKKRERILSCSDPANSEISCTLRKIDRGKRVSRLTAFIAAQYQNGCEHRFVGPENGYILPEIDGCGCYEFLRELFFGVNIIVKPWGGCGKKYKLIVET